MKKLFLIILSAISFFVLMSMSKHPNTNYFVVVNASEQAYHSGIRGGGSGNYYHITLVMNKNVSINFDSIAINGMKTKTEITNCNFQQVHNFKIGDTVKLLSTLSLQDMERFMQQETKQITVAKNNLLYTIRNKSCNQKLQTSLPDFKKEQPLFYP